ncbi:MAG TPA: dTDP-4-dehydrorhamnose 3,5-epimerase [Planctomycetaceae bacterium]|nr:dTDP-4-dehydrorhamnose 3,5-epimerase [Planctomycetaceae bacterium]
MQIHKTALPGVLVFEPRVFGDARGYFKETWHRERYESAGVPGRFVQDNFSRSRQGTLRGLHFQRRHPQGKLVQVFRGEVFDVAVDVRRGSETFGRWDGIVLSETNHRQLYIPPGFAHGFCVLSETADVFYKCTAQYHPDDERTLLWNDPAVAIEWPLAGEPVLSEKDRRGTPLADLECCDVAPMDDE